MQKTGTRDAKSGFGCNSARKGGEGLPLVLTVGKTIRLCAYIYRLAILLPVPLVAPLTCLEYASYHQICSPATVLSPAIVALTVRILSHSYSECNQV